MKLLSTLAASVIVMAIASCSTVPITNVSDAAVATSTGKSLSREQVRSAIVRAGGKLGWTMTDESPNILIGTLQLRTHSAVIEIPYSTSSYSIKYRSSVNMEEKGGSIHKNYNGWIQNLHRDINTQLAAS